MIKAYMVYIRDYMDEWAMLEYAETPGKAKNKAFHDIGCDPDEWKDLRAKRVPIMDSLYNKNPTVRQWFDSNWLQECAGCQTEYGISHDADIIWLDDEHFYCEECSMILLWNLTCYLTGKEDDIESFRSYDNDTPYATYMGDKFYKDSTETYTRYAVASGVQHSSLGSDCVCEWVTS